MNWFKRHLNWTWVLAYFVTITLAFLVGLVLVLAEPTINDDTLTFAGGMIGIVGWIAASGWVIREKGRSLWWILLSGWLSPLWLENNKKLKEQASVAAFTSQTSTHPISGTNSNHGIQFCTKCGTRFVNEGRFCAKCGVERPMVQLGEAR